MHTIEIQVLTGVSAGDVFTFSLGTGDSVKIGRADSNELVLSDPRVSRTHCGILSRQDGLYLYDLGSAAGTVHMGFQLKSGEEGARPLHTSDEFKIGDSLFRVRISAPTVEAGSTDGAKGDTAAKTPRNRTLLYGALAAGILLLAVVFLIPDGPKKPSLPPQKSSIAINLPSYKMVGYWPGGSSTPRNRKDSTHIDKAQFLIPATDHLVEFEYLSEVDLEALIDGVLVETLPAHASGWQRREWIVRDVAQGVERRLVFDNPSYPSKKPTTSYKRWAVRNVRVTPIERPLDATVERAVRDAIALSNNFDVRPDGLTKLVRALQQVALELLVEQSSDVLPIAIEKERNLFSTDAEESAELEETLSALLRERGGEYDAELDERHLEAVADSIARFDGELWSRVDSRFRQAKHSAKANNSIVVYDNLLAIKTMFPDESDFRWLKANRMFMDNKYVPKKVRRNPERYRR